MSAIRFVKSSAHAAAILTAVCMISGPVPAAETGSGALKGTATAVNGRVLIINGNRLTLADISVPPLGRECVMRGKLRDCGKFARLGLTELVVAAQIECRRAANQTYRCTTEHGYDLAFGQIHAGWAVPTRSGPQHYFVKMQEAKAKKRMLWSATLPEDGRTVAAALLQTP